MKHIISLILVLSFMIVPIAQAKDKKSQDLAPLTLGVLSEAALTGMQLSVKKAAQDGKAANSVYECVSLLTPSAFNSVYAPFFTEKFTPEEQIQTESFFKGTIGKKYSKHGLLQIYSATGSPLPEPLPTFSSEEMRGLEAFSKTTAGEKLLLKHVMQTPEVNVAVQSKIKELLSVCGK